MKAPPIIVPSQGLQRALTKALGTCNSVAPQLEYLQNLAVHCPEISESVDQLSVMHAHLDALARAGLTGVVTDSGEEGRG